MKNFLFKDGVVVFIIFLCFFNAISVYELFTTSYAAWYFKYFAVAYVIVSAFFILCLTSDIGCHNVKLSESNISRYSYLSNINYIKKRTALLEDEIILKSVATYAKQLELKENTDKKFNNFETLYNYFNTLDTKEKWLLLDQLPFEYQKKLLQYLIID
jgi:hypothetical protein